jgi:hypothetical protein
MKIDNAVESASVKFAQDTSEIRETRTLIQSDDLVYTVETPR